MVICSDDYPKVLFIQQSLLTMKVAGSPCACRRKASRVFPFWGLFQT
ncbi:hypothetical protein [Candidatus Symbiopectobacterium sp.]|nr:hypothetical protein [Candidatus Symbiopectobacterium sp.]